MTLDVAPAPEQVEIQASVDTREPWLKAATQKYSRRLANQVILAGEVMDEVHPGIPVCEYIALHLRPTRPMVIMYSIDRGITFADESKVLARFDKLETLPPSAMRKQFEATLGLNVAPPSAAAAALQQARQPAQPQQQASANLPRMPKDALPLLYRYARLAPEKSTVIIIDRLDYVLPPPSVTPYSVEDRALLAEVFRAGTDRVLDGKMPFILMLTPSILRVHEDLRMASSGTPVVDVPLPNFDERLAYIRNYVLGRGWRIETRDGESEYDAARSLARRTAGLGRRHIEDIAIQSGDAGVGIITNAIIQQRRKELISAEYSGVLEVIEPTEGFDSHAGHYEAKEFLIEEVAGPMRSGLVELLKYVPMGLRFTGPPGTGKTHLAYCLAYECQVPLIILRAENIKGGIVGESERLLAQALRGIEASAPCAVFVDEVDLALPRPNGSGSGGDSVEANKFGRLLEFTGDTSHQGSIIFIGACNNPQVVDAALFREGRMEEGVPLLAPDSFAERLDMITAMLALYGQPMPDVSTQAWLAKKLDGYTQAEIKGLAKDASGRAVRKGESISDAILVTMTNTRRNSRVEYQRMRAAAIADCTNLRLLPPSVRIELDKEPEKFEAESVQLRDRAASGVTI